MPYRTLNPDPQRHPEHAGTLETLARLEAAMMKLADGMVLYRDDVQALKLQHAHAESRMVAMETDWKSAVTGITGSFQAEFKEMAMRMDHLSGKFDEQTKPQRALWFSATGVAVTIIALVGAVGRNYMDTSLREALAPVLERQLEFAQLTAPLHELELAQTRSTAADARSEQDRAELNRRVSEGEAAQIKGLADRTEQIANINAGRAEIETQFKNLTAMTLYLWNSVEKKPWPIVPREEAWRK